MGRRRPHDPALWCVDEAGGARCYSFAELADRFRRASGFLHKAGIQCGDRVLVMLPRVPAWWIEMLGLIRLGAVPIPATTLLTAKDIAYRVQAAGITAILTDADGAAKAVGFGGIVILDDELETGLAKAAADFEPAPTRPDDPTSISPAARPGRRRWCCIRRRATPGIASPASSGSAASRTTCIGTSPTTAGPKPRGRASSDHGTWARALLPSIRGNSRRPPLRTLARYRYHVVRAAHSAAAHRA